MATADTPLEALDLGDLAAGLRAAGLSVRDRHKDASHETDWQRWWGWTGCAEDNQAFAAFVGLAWRDSLWCHWETVARAIHNVRHRYTQPVRT